MRSLLNCQGKLGCGVAKNCVLSEKMLDFQNQDVIMKEIYLYMWTPIKNVYNLFVDAWVD